MKIGSRGIPLNCSIVVPVWSSIKHTILTLHEKHDIKRKWTNIQVQNKIIVEIY